MRRSFFLLFFLIGLFFLANLPAKASGERPVLITSPDHRQTFAYGSELRRVWAQRGPDKHLVLLLDFTNDPYVDTLNPRQYDYFVFHFPGVRLGSDGRTFYYRESKGEPVAIARRQLDFLGFPEIKLLPSSSLIISKPHGYLTVSILAE